MPTNPATTAAALGTSTTAMTMPMPTMSGDDSGGGGLMAMSAMSMTFFHSAGTPLFWDWWKPSGPAQYAATCVFLIVLAAVTRILFAVRPVLYANMPGGSRRGGDYSAPHATERLLAGEGKAGGETDDAGADAPSAWSIRAAAGAARRWWGGASLGQRLGRAFCEVVLVCLGYFL